MDLVDRIQSTKFLGKDFLTWLMYRSEAKEGLVSIPDLGTVEVWFEDKVTLNAADGSKEQNVVRADNPAESPEARAALKMGKKVAETKLRLILGQQKWGFVLKGESLALSGVKIPAVLAREADDQVFERLEYVEQLNNILSGLYREYVQLRLRGDEWAKELKAMRAWLAHADA